MRYALVNDVKQEAFKGGRGKCLCCGADVIARCGDIRKHHWAHMNNEECAYSSKEPKTPWHIRWQECFPENWREFRCFDEINSQYRIADIKTPHGLVVEFQHSAIKPGERLARELFYKKMVWVVDGARYKNDFLRFAQNLKIPFEDLREYKSFDGLLPERWFGARVPVYLDFKSETKDHPVSELEKALRSCMWGFFEYGQRKFVAAIPHENFVQLVQRERILEIFPPLPQQVFVPQPRSNRPAYPQRKDSIQAGESAWKVNKKGKQGRRF